MNILVTNIAVSQYTGTETYIRELVIELKKREHQVEIYTLIKGELAKELMGLGINVTTNLRNLRYKPDVIHAHHNIITLRALSKFRNVPAIYFIHDRVSEFDFPLRHQNIIQYAAVDYNCKERYCDENNFEDEDVTIIYNWVNTSRFKRKETIALKPKKALVFSNYLSEKSIYPEIQEACKALGIELSIVGYSSGNFCLEPEKIIGQYDLVFAKAKAAIEAMATAAAVVVCDFRGLGGMVTRSNLLHFRRFNFGMKLMTKEPSVPNLIEEILKYNPEEVATITDFMIQDADFLNTITKIERQYSEIIIKYKRGERGKYKSTFKNQLMIYRLTFLARMHLVFRNYFPKGYEFVRLVYRSLFKRR